MREVLRIWSRSAPYRRAGLAFGSIDEYVEVDPDALAPKVLAILAADDNLVIKGPDGQGGWEVMPAEVCALAGAQLATLDDQDRAEIAAEGLAAIMPAGPPVEIDPELRAMSELGRAITTVFYDHREMLAQLNLWPAESIPATLAELINVASAASSDLTEAKSDVEKLKAELAAEKAQQTHTPREEEQDGGGGDGAAPAGGEEYQGAAPETVGEAAQDGEGDPPPGKPVAKGKPARSRAG